MIKYFIHTFISHLHILYHLYLPFQTVDDEKGNTNMDELIEAQISSKDELMDLMNEGEKQRHGKHLRLCPNLFNLYLRRYAKNVIMIFMI